MAFRLPRLPYGWRDQPQLFERYWDEFATNIEKTLNAILEIPEIAEALQDAIDAAEAAADNAQTAADNAQTAADDAASATAAQAQETSLVNSYPSAGVPILSADSTGLVTIATHNRVYGDSALNPTVSVTGNTVASAAAALSIVRVYYDDPTRAGGAVTYGFTVDPAAPPVQSGNRHSVGAVEIPAVGSQDGRPLGPPGYVDYR